jgi:hypothetical protein
MKFQIDQVIGGLILKRRQATEHAAKNRKMQQKSRELLLFPVTDA